MTLWALLTTLLALLALLKLWFWWRRAQRRQRERATTVAFFHPYWCDNDDGRRRRRMTTTTLNLVCVRTSNGGGGGERVLWRAIEVLFAEFEARNAPLRCVVYTGDSVSSGDILKLAKVRRRSVERAEMTCARGDMVVVIMTSSLAQNRFGLDLARFGDALQFVFLRARVLVEDSSYPMLTLLGQSVGSMALGLEAAVRLSPDVYVDTMGYAFTFPIFRWLVGSRVACYVHYPTISTDMLAAVAERRPTSTNSESVATSTSRSQLKLMYVKKRLSRRLFVVGRRRQ